MGVRNYLVEGVSGAGKTSVATELQQRGHHVIHGDRELAYRGDPETGERLSSAASARLEGGPAAIHRHHLWDVEKVSALTDDASHPVTFFCGGSRNFEQFADRFDGVFLLVVDLETLEARLAARPADEFGGMPAERDFIRRLHAAGEGLPANAIPIDATVPLVDVVDAILARVSEPEDAGSVDRER